MVKMEKGVKRMTHFLVVEELVFLPNAIEGEESQCRRVENIPIHDAKQEGKGDHGEEGRVDLRDKQILSQEQATNN